MDMYFSFTAAILRAMFVCESSVRQALTNTKSQLKMFLGFRTNTATELLLGAHGNVTGI